MYPPHICLYNFGECDKDCVILTEANRFDFIINFWNDLRLC